MNEEDTFLKLSRKPLDEVIRNWSGGLKLYGDDMEKYVASQKYTLREFFGGWFDMYVTSPAGILNKELWIEDNLEYHTWLLLQKKTPF